MDETYRNQKEIEYTLKYREILQTLPNVCREYFRAIEDTTTALTRLNYAYDLRIFFQYLHSEQGCSDLSLTDLDALSLTDFEKYVEYLSYYSTEDDIVHQNKDKGKARKIASLRAFFKYLYKKQYLANNLPSLLSTPKLYQKAITRLSADEAAELMHNIEAGTGLSKKEMAYHKKTVQRDSAIILLFLTTGIRVSELVGLNIGDVDLDTMSIRIVRKGGNEAILYFSRETEQVIGAYLEERKQSIFYTLDAPLFLSIQNKRLTVRAVQNLVKKYAQRAVPLKKISPHKLRSTYGTLLYQESGDIYLVADVLGHKDVNTTRKHYAAMDETRRREAAKYVKIRNSEKPED